MEKPSIRITKEINYFDAKNWLIETGKVTDVQEDKVWDWMCDYLCITNDSSHSNPFSEDIDDPDIAAFSKAFVEEFPDADHIYVSW